MSEMFRCSGDIVFDDQVPMPGLISNVQLKKYSESSNFLQCLQPLTPKNPYFFAQIRALAIKSRITIGIAGPDIDRDAHPGHWNNTVGYQSDTGHCFTSHYMTANTKGEKFSKGVMFGVLVSYFGKDMSTVVFLRNGAPVATRYLYEKDHTRFLPTISLEHGPIDIGVMWPAAAMWAPKMEETNMLNWIKEDSVSYDLESNVFRKTEPSATALLQSPCPLSKDFVHFEVIVMETEGGESPSVGLATCSPLMPSPTCSLLRDFIQWKANGKELKVKEGQRIGFGVHYNPDLRWEDGFDARAQQLVLCFVTLDQSIVFFRMMVQPVGGFYPLVALTDTAPCVCLDVETNRDLGDEATRALLDKLYKEKEEEAVQMLERDRRDREIPESLLRKSPDVEIISDNCSCVLKLHESKKRIHTVQLKQPLINDHFFFYLEIIKLNEDSVVSIGIGDETFPLNKHPGKHTPSVGYVSKDGKMYYDQKTAGNIEGIRYAEGDQVRVAIRKFVTNGDTVVLFYKNDQPVGTRFLSIKDHAQFFPTVSLCGNGYNVEVHVHWPNRLSQAPVLYIDRLNHWCMPEECQVDTENHIITVKDHQNPIYIQAAQYFNPGFNHFEIELISEVGGGCPAPFVSLVAANIMDGPKDSHFRLDNLQFWPVNKAENSVKTGDLMGWGMFVPDSEKDKEDKMVICYLTINRDIVLTRVMFEPPGGLYPLVGLPGGVNKVKFEMTALEIVSHPLTEEKVEELLLEAKEIYTREQEFLSTGKDLDDYDFDATSLMKLFKESSSALEKDGNSKNSSPKFRKIVAQMKGIDSVQKAMNKYQTENSRACAIL